MQRCRPVGGFRNDLNLAADQRRRHLDRGDFLTDRSSILVRKRWRRTRAKL